MDELKVIALQEAIKVTDYQATTDEQIVARATAFYDFLRGASKTDA